MCEGKTIAKNINGKTVRYACYLDGLPLLLQYKTLDELVAGNPDYREEALEFFRKEVKSEAVHLAVDIDEVINDPNIFMATEPYGHSLKATLTMIMEGDTDGIKDDLDDLALCGKTALQDEAKALKQKLECFEHFQRTYVAFIQRHAKNAIKREKRYA